MADLLTSDNAWLAFPQSHAVAINCPHIAMQENVGVSKLVIQLLGLFTAEAMAAANDAEKDSLLSVLLAAAAGPAAGASGSAVRAAAISRLTPELYAQLSEAAAVQVLQVLCFLKR